MNVEDPEVHGILEDIRSAGAGVIKRWGREGNDDAERALNRLRKAARSVVRAHAGDPVEPPPIDPPPP